MYVMNDVYGKLAEKFRKIHLTNSYKIHNTCSQKRGCPALRTGVMVSSMVYQLSPNPLYPHVLVTVHNRWS